MVEALKSVGASHSRSKLYWNLSIINGELQFFNCAFLAWLSKMKSN